MAEVLWRVASFLLEMELSIENKTLHLVGSRKQDINMGQLTIKRLGGA